MDTKPGQVLRSPDYRNVAQAQRPVSETRVYQDLARDVSSTEAFMSYLELGDFACLLADRTT